MFDSAVETMMCKLVRGHLGWSDYRTNHRDIQRNMRKTNSPINTGTTSYNVTKHLITIAEKTTTTSYEDSQLEALKNLSNYDGQAFDVDTKQIQYS